MVTLNTHFPPRRSKFIFEYLIDLNGSEAAKRAGYSPERARITASLLLDNPEIKKAINKELESRQKRTLITADRVLAELYEMAMTDVSDMFNDDGSIKAIKEIPESLRRAIAGFEIEEVWDWEETDEGRRHKVQTGVVKKIKLWDKGRALENLAKHLRLLDADKTIIDQSTHYHYTKINDAELINKSRERGLNLPAEIARRVTATSGQQPA